MLEYTKAIEELFGGPCIGSHVLISNMSCLRVYRA